MMKSLAKHARGRREFFCLCNAKGGLPGLAVEVRRTQRLRLEEAMAAAAEKAENRIPVVAHRSDKQPWKVTLKLDDFLLLYRAYLQTVRPDPKSPSSEAYHNSDPDPDRLLADDPVS